MTKSLQPEADEDSVSQSIIDQSHDEHLTTQLPDHLVALILRNLNIPDRTRATLVCKSWKNILMGAHIPPPRDEAPWLITSNDSYYKPKTFLSEIHLKSLSDKRTYCFKLPNPYGDFGGGWLCGSSRGWLLIATGLEFNPSMFLWNPITGSIRKLPPLSTLPFFSGFVEDSVRVFATNVSSFIPTIEVFSAGSEECVVAAIFRNPLDTYNVIQNDRLALCTPHDKAWTVYRPDHEDIKYEDILSHKGKLHALTAGVDVYSDEDIENWDASETIRLSGCEVELQTVSFYKKITDESVSISSKSVDVGHLVECSITGEILCVRALYVCVPIRPFTRLYKMVDYKIYSLKRTPWYEVMSSLGEQTVFVGTTGSVAVKGGVEGGGGDRIYFATDEPDLVVDHENLFMVRYEGVFNVQERRIRGPCVKYIGYPLQSKIGWFTPN